MERQVAKSDNGKVNTQCLYCDGVAIFRPLPLADFHSGALALL